MTKAEVVSAAAAMVGVSGCIYRRPAINHSCCENSVWRRHRCCCWWDSTFDGRCGRIRCRLSWHIGRRLLEMARGEISPPIFFSSLISPHSPPHSFSPSPLLHLARFPLSPYLYPSPFPISTPKIQVGGLEQRCNLPQRVLAELGCQTLRCIFRNQVVPLSLRTFPENFMQIGSTVFL